MLKPLIMNGQENGNMVINNQDSSVQQFCWGDDVWSQKMAESFAKILWKKKFKKSSIQEYDDQIVSVVKEVYLPPEERVDEVGNWLLDRDTSFLMHAAYNHRTDNIILIC